MDLYYAVADPTRRNILELLSNRGKLSATDISDMFQVSAPAISQHLKILRDTNLVAMEKKAQKRIYSVNPATLMEIEQWIEKMTKDWDGRFSKLDKLLEVEKKKLSKGGVKI